MIGVCWMLISVAKDIAIDLRSINTDTNKFDLFIQFAEFIELHSNAMQLSQSQKVLLIQCCMTETDLKFMEL